MHINEPEELNRFATLKIRVRARRQAGVEFPSGSMNGFTGFRQQADRHGPPIYTGYVTLDRGPNYRMRQASCPVMVDSLEIQSLHSPQVRKLIYNKLVQAFVDLAGVVAEKWRPRTKLDEWLEAITKCEPERAAELLLVFSDWLEERADDRAGELRRIVKRGPIAVEPITPRSRPYGINYWLVTEPDVAGDTVTSGPPLFWGYADDGRDWCPECGRITEPAPAHHLFVCFGCDETFWISFATKAKAHREMLHRMRVEALAWFWKELDLGQPPYGAKIDPRWPEMHVEIPINDHEHANITCTSNGMSVFVWTRIWAEPTMDGRPGRLVNTGNGLVYLRDEEHPRTDDTPG